jgi:hypothetical protein
MPDTTIIKLKVRRGTDVQRTAIILEEGELGYTTDTKKLFVGDGTTYGGNPVSPTFFTPINQQDSLINLRANQGDVVTAGSLLYQLTGSDYAKLSSWAMIGTVPDNTTLEYTGTQQRVLSLKSNSVGGNSFNSTAAYNAGGLIATRTNGLSANVDGTSIIIDANNKLAAVGSNISTALVGAGLAGGGTDPIRINIQENFAFNNGTGYLKLTSLPSKIAGIDAVETSELYSTGLTLDGSDKLKVDSSYLAGYGLTQDLTDVNKLAVNPSSLYIANSGLIFDNTQKKFYVSLTPFVGQNLSINSTTGKLDAASTPLPGDGFGIDYDSNTNTYNVNSFSLGIPGSGIGYDAPKNGLYVDLNPLVGGDFVIQDNVLELNTVTTDNTISFGTITYNNKGLITNTESSFVDALTCNQSTSSPLSIFNGFPSQISDGASRNGKTLINVTSAFQDDLGDIITQTLTLTSAGFVTVDPQYIGGVNGFADRFAIPIFTY